MSWIEDNAEEIYPDSDITYGAGAVREAYAYGARAALERVTVPADSVNSVEELDALPVGSVILSERYRYSMKVPNYPVAFQKLYTKEWHRGGRVAETHPDLIVPATVLHRPEES